MVKSIIKVIGIIIFLISIFNLILFSMYDFNSNYIEIDSCLDNGGKWDYKESICEGKKVDE